MQKARMNCNIILSIVLIAAAAYGIETWRTTRLGYLVNKYNDHRNAQEYEEALQTAQTMFYFYPNETISQHIHMQSRIGMHEVAEGGALPNYQPNGITCTYCGKICAFPLDFKKVYFD